MPSYVPGQHGILRRLSGLECPHTVKGDQETSSSRVGWSNCEENDRTGDVEHHKGDHDVDGLADSPVEEPCCQRMRAESDLRSDEIQTDLEAIVWDADEERLGHLKGLAE